MRKLRSMTLGMKQPTSIDLVVVDFRGLNLGFRMGIWKSEIGDFFVR
jgi:hypothetical protein